MCMCVYMRMHIGMCVCAGSREVATLTHGNGPIACVYIHVYVCVRKHMYMCITMYIRIIIYIDMYMYVCICIYNIVMC